MGYSEIHCHLCGVSFNVARIRTAAEPRAYAWNMYGTKHPGFVSADEYSFVDDFCSEEAGCQIAFRKDGVPIGADAVNQTYEKIRAKLHVLQMQQRADKSLMEDLSIYEDDWNDSDFDPKECLDAELSDEYDMDYEFEEPPEECEDVSTEDLPSCGEDIQAKIIYSEWAAYVLQSDDKRNESSLEPNGGRETRQEARAAASHARMANSMLTNEHKELMLPLYKPSNFDPGDYLDPGTPPPKHSGVSSSPHRRNFSFINHRLNAGRPSNWRRMSEARHWEHIAGQNCTQPRGYNGTNISYEEMKSICTSQCLFEDYTETDAESSSNIRGREAPNFTLSGLCFNMPSRDWAIPTYDGIEYEADNYNYGWGRQGDDWPLAVPFHPSCLEVYKRICLKRSGEVNLTQLGGWWRIVTTDNSSFDQIPRDVAVHRGSSQCWEYEPGDEWLAANPCLVPELKQTLEAAMTGQDVQMNSKEWKGSEHQKSRIADYTAAFTDLPADVYRIILEMLSAVDLANLSLAVPPLEPLIRTMIRSALIQDHPYLWELWCDLKYPIAVGMSGIEDRKFREEAHPRNEEAQRISATLREDGFDDMADRVDERHRLNEAALRYEIESTVLANQAECVNGKQVDYIKLTFALHQALESDKMKGLRNRARIWEDCNWILDDINRLKEEGKLLHDGKISFETWRGLRL